MVYQQVKMCIMCIIDMILLVIDFYTYFRESVIIMQSDKSSEENQECCSEESESEKQQVEPEKPTEAQL